MAAHVLSIGFLVIFHKYYEECVGMCVFVSVFACLTCKEFYSVISLSISVHVHVTAKEWLLYAQRPCALSEDSDQPGHPPSLIRVFAVRSMGS